MPPMQSQARRSKVEPIQDPEYVETPANAAGQPLWWRMRAMAHLAGMTPDLFKLAVERGEIPIRLQAFGSRGILFANRADCVAWLQTHRTAKVPA